MVCVVAEESGRTAMVNGRRGMEGDRGTRPIDCGMPRFGPTSEDDQEHVLIDTRRHDITYL